MKMQIITTVLLATVVTSAASAGPLENAWNRQQVSIGRGILDKSLTPREVIRLERQAISIRRQAAHFSATGGGLSLPERVYLGARLLAARGSIYYHRHN